MSVLAYLIGWVIVAFAVAIICCIISDSIAAICERKRRKKYRNNYVRFR